MITSPEPPTEANDARDTKESSATVDRRGFVRIAVTAAAVGGGIGGGGLAVTGAAAAQGRGAPPQQRSREWPPLGNGEPPAMQFQAYPGGTGAYMEKLIRERGIAAFERVPIEPAPWTGPAPVSETEIAFLPAHRLSALIRARGISSVELTRIYLDRLKRLDPTLLCAVTIMEGQALEAAQQADAEIRAGDYRGPLHGLPWGVKDLFSTRGVRTTWGSSDFENRIIDEDAEVVVRLREAGAVLIAKLATGLFAQGDRWYRGQTKNPWNLEQGSSGSSAGPGSATAAGCVAFSIGTETQGSIVSPARRCSVSALRPTFGRVSRYGGMVLAWSMDKVGPLCRTIEDCALVFNAIHGASEKDPATLTAPFRFDRDPDLSTLRIGYDERAPEAFVAKLRELGADPVPVGDRPDSRGVSQLNAQDAAAFEMWVDALPPLPPDSAEAMAAGRGGRGGGGAGSRGRFTRGREVSAVEFLQAERRRLILMHEMADFMKDLDMYVSGSGDVGLTNQTGNPAAVVPCGMTESDSPQPETTTIIGDLFADDLILSVAHKYQVATDWHTRHPALG
ncbi:MAG: amidase [Gemmatimonadota bacterium]|jgi:Asp-tRNA(Asn)/Glu-tRNA(Gln) amidotransferase A subunit family amidase